MNYIIEQALRAKITGLSFIERYGGIVRPMTYKSEGKVPVSTLLTADQCKDPSFYKLLIPDSNYKSVSYLENLGITGPAFSGPKQNVMTFNSRLRFVCWMNLRALGISDDYNPERFAVEAITTIKGRTDFTVDSISGDLQVLRFTMGGTDPQRVFGQYSYADKEKLYFDPYGFFYFDMEVELNINAACVSALTLSAPLNCVGVWTG